MVHARTILTALLTVGFLSSFTSAVASQTLSEDEKILATYRLTMPNVKKAMAVVQSVAAELAKDPKVQEHTKLKKELQTLEKKDELTEAEEAQAEKLRERIEVRHGKVQANLTSLRQPGSTLYWKLLREYW